MSRRGRRSTKVQTDGQEYDLVRLDLTKEQFQSLASFVQGVHRDLEAVRGLTGAAIFTGINRAGVDEKGRIFMPSTIRAENEEGRYALVKHAEGLWLMTMVEYREIVRDLLKASADSKSAREAKALFFYHSEANLTLDANNRLSIPRLYRDSLSKEGPVREVILAGSGNIIEIWGPSDFLKHHSSLGTKGMQG